MFSGPTINDSTHEQRQHVCVLHPREASFKENIVNHFAKGVIGKPLTTLGKVRADVPALKDLSHQRMSFCSIILGSP